MDADDSRVSLGALEEFQTELAHLLETDSENGSLGVSTETESINKSSSERNNVLERSRERNTGDIVDSRNVEDGWSVENGVPKSGVDR